MKARFEVQRPPGGDWYYQFVTADNQVMLRSEGHKTLASCIKGIESCREHSPYDRFYNRSDDSLGFTFRLRASNNKVISQGPGCASAEERERIISAVKRYASSALINDLR
ncbi:YegP family protein [Pseudomonas mosselii]|uniref:YegP family protein n=1 Tax=Pseudomonas mosselii TaxID=78327 RepID=UPI0035A25785